VATEYSLRRSDRQPLGTFTEVEARLSRLFPGVEFFWTTSGVEKLRHADENGVELPDPIRAWMATLPSLREGIYEGDEFLVEFGLGFEEPVACLSVVPRGVSPQLFRLLDALEVEFGGLMVVSGSEPQEA